MVNRLSWEGGAESKARRIQLLSSRSILHCLPALKPEPVTALAIPPLQ